MKIYIDISVLTLATFLTGIQRVTEEIVVHMLQEKEFSIILLHFNAKQNCYYQIDNEAFLQYYVNKKGKKEKMISKKKISVGDIKSGSLFFDIDAVWMCRLKRSYLYPLLKQQGVILIPHIYDIISIEYPQYCLERGVYNFMDYIGACLLYADEIIVNANATVDALARLAEQTGTDLPPCHVVPLGADYQQNKQNENASETKMIQIDNRVKAAVESGPYILMVGTVEPRKNHKLLLDAYDTRLKEMGYHIIFAGYLGWNMEEFEKRLNAHPDKDNGVYHFENLNDDNISYLYQKADFMAYCSYMEGYGLPLIEAFHRGTPVIAADMSVTREVAGDYCIYFKQDDIEDFCNQLMQIKSSPEKYAAMKSRLSNYNAITWKESAGRMGGVLSNAGKRIYGKTE